MECQAVSGRQGGWELPRLQADLARGPPAAEAAAAALAADAALAAGRGQDLDAGAAALAASLSAFDEPAAQAALDRLLADFTVESVLTGVILPALRELGQQWADSQLGIACEHFASNIVRGRLAGLARGWSQGQGPARCWPARPASSTRSA